MSTLFGALVGIITRFQTQYVGFINIFFAYIWESAPHCRIGKGTTCCIHIKNKRPFTIEAIVVLPDHLHAIWRLLDGDADFSTRWRTIKHDFSIALQDGVVSPSQQRKGEKGIWQRRFWEHAIRNETDWCRHIDYIHFNPVKHGYVTSPSTWPYSSFLRAVEKGWYPPDWGQQEPDSVKSMHLE